MEKLPKIIVGVLIYNDAGEILLARSHKWKDKWITPGGHLDWGETLEQGVRREVKEETNLDIENIDFLSVQEGVYDNEHYNQSHMIFLNYTALSASENIILNNELQEFRWFQPEEALKDDLIKNVLEVVEQFISKRDTLG